MRHRRLVTACLLLAFVFPALPRATAQAAPSDALQSLLDSRIARFSGGVGIVVSDPLSGTQLYAHDPDELVITASLYKLAVLLEAERRVEVKLLSYSTPVTIEPEDITEDGSFEVAGTTLSLDEALERMITISDNGTALDLERSFTPQAINATLAANRIAPFRLGENESEDNAASPRAVATFFTLLAQKKLVSAAASERMVARLARQQINDRLPANLPQGTVVAHKTGNLGFMTHDAGIIFGKNGDPVVVVAMTWNSGEEEAVNLIRDLGSLVYANAVTTPTNAGYGLPQQPVAVDAGRPFVQMVKLTNLGSSDWNVTDSDPFKLVWEIADTRGAVVTKSAQPIRLWSVPINGSIDVPVILNVPERLGDYKVIFGLADQRHGPLASLGTATGSFQIQAHAPYVVDLDVALSPVLHRDEPSAAIVTMSALPELSGDRTLELGWRVLDPRNQRVLSQSTAPLGMAKRATTSRVLSIVMAPALRGSYILEAFAVSGGHPVSAVVRKFVTIAGPRTYPGELEPGSGRGVSPTPRPTPRPSAGRTPVGKTPPPLPRP